MTSFIQTWVLPYWHLFVSAAVLSLFGEFFKKYVFTKARAKTNAVWLWVRRTMPLHPVVAGALLGLIPGMPLPDGVEGLTSSALYYAASGLLSTWGYNLFKQWLAAKKAKQRLTQAQAEKELAVFEE